MEKKDSTNRVLIKILIKFFIA